MPAIELHDVSKSFERPGGRGHYPALQGIDLTIEEGEFLCLLGPTGCGKSTILHLVAGFETPTSGEITVSGSSVRGPNPGRGVVFQSEVALFPWLTVEENVAYGPRVRGLASSTRSEVVEHHLKMVGLAQHRHKFPRELSGGMKQRVQIARVLANDPSILLMDEPFGALDAQTRSHLQKELAQIWAETHKTIVFVTHDIGEAIHLGDRVAVMTPGPHSRIKQVIRLTLPRPRDRLTDEFVEIYNRLNAEIEASIHPEGASE